MSNMVTYLTSWTISIVWCVVNFVAQPNAWAELNWKSIIVHVKWKQGQTTNHGMKINFLLRFSVILQNVSLFFNVCSPLVKYNAFIHLWNASYCGATIESMFLYSLFHGICISCGLHFSCRSHFNVIHLLFFSVNTKRKALFGRFFCTRNIEMLSPLLNI